MEPTAWRWHDDQMPKSRSRSVASQKRGFNAERATEPNAMPNIWIATRLANLRSTGRAKDQKGLADYLGLPKPRITEIIRGRRRIDLHHELPMLADYLEMTEMEAVDMMAHELLLPNVYRQRLVRGIVESGVFRSRSELVPEPKLSPLCPDRRYPKAEQVVFEVRHLRKEGFVPTYPAGSFLLCVGLDQLGRKPEIPDHVICERRQGKLFEITCREFSKSEIGMPKDYKPVAAVIGAYISHGEQNR